MMKFVRVLFMSIVATGFILPWSGCGGPEYAEEGEGQEMLQPGAMEAAAGGAAEEIQP